MNMFKADCGRCGTKQSAMTVGCELKARDLRYIWFVFCICGTCHQPTLFELDYPADITSLQDDGAFYNRILATTLNEQFPQLPSPNKIENLPPNVAHIYVEAENCFASGSFSAAGSCYRKTIERSLKHLDTSLTGMLNQRIRALEKQNVIPAAMIELLDQVRLFGNESMHEDDYDPKQEDCSAAREFCELFLTYVFALPQKIENAKQNREQKTNS